MFKNKKYRPDLDTGDINAVNRFISSINTKQLNGEAVEILVNKRVTVKAVLLRSNADLAAVDIDATNGVHKTGRELRDLLESKLARGITIATKSGEVVRVYQEAMEQVRDDIGQVFNTPSSIPPPPIPAMA